MQLVSTPACSLARPSGGCLAPSRRGYANTGGGGGPRRGGASWRQRQEAPAPSGPRRNHEIKAREVRLVFPAEEDKPATVMPLQAALK